MKHIKSNSIIIFFLFYYEIITEKKQCQGFVYNYRFLVFFKYYNFLIKLTIYSSIVKVDFQIKIELYSEQIHVIKKSNNNLNRLLNFCLNQPNKKQPTR